jgi:hypothetical protein
MPTPGVETLQNSNRRLLFFLMAIAILLGILDGVYGTVRYSGDGISYLNVVRAIHAGDWKLALNPLWGLGYPLILSAITPLFPQTPAGEWSALLCVNLAILAASFWCFYFLVLTAARTASFAWIMEDARSRRLLILGAFAIFLSVELSMDHVSRIGPDMLISCLVFAGCAVLLKLRENPTAGLAISLGAISGFGFLTKNVFLPLTLVFAGLMLLSLGRKRAGILYSAIMLASAAVLMLPYAYGLSWAAGYPSFGESGSLNYAWHVNKLLGEAFWQGGPAVYGSPIHPPQLVIWKPHVYLFEKPFPVTYPPFFNPPYFYQGYRHFFSLRNQSRALARNGLSLVNILKTQFMLLALAACFFLSQIGRPKIKLLFRKMASLWPLLVFAFTGVVIYLLVWVEARYIASLLAIILLAAWLGVMAAGRETPEGGSADSAVWKRALIVPVLMLGCAATLLANQHDEDRNVLGNALHHATILNSPQWKAGLYLQRIGMEPGDPVAIVSDIVQASRATWAYNDKLRIIGQVDAEQQPGANDDFDTFWHSSAQDQRRVLEIFHSAGARLVFAQAKPDGVSAEGWERIPETDYWIYRFEEPSRANPR